MSLQEPQIASSTYMETNQDLYILHTQSLEAIFQ